MSREIINSESTPVSTQKLFLLITEIEKTVKTLSGYISINSFKYKKTELLSGYMLNKSLLNPLFNSPSIKNTHILFSSVFLLEAEFKNLFHSLYKYHTSSFSSFSISTNTTVSSTLSLKDSYP
jgi:hypothetical protein